MATGLPSNLYTGGAAEFDTSPYVNFYAQTMARKQAKDEALNQYNENLFKTINPAGARTQDIPMFTEKVNEWQRFYQQNRDAIKNPRLDGGRAQSEFQARMVDAQNYIQQSKNEAKVYSDLVPLLRDPEKRSRIPESVIEELSLHDLPLGDPRRKSFNMASLIFDPKPLDVKTEEAYFGGLGKRFKMDELITGSMTDPNTFNRNITTTAAFGPEAKAGIASSGVQRYGFDPSFKKHIDDTLLDKGAYDQLNDVYKKEFGKDIQTGEEGAIAYTLAGMQQSFQKQKSEADWKARQDYLQGQRIALLNKRLAAEKSGKSEADGWINEYIGVLKNQAMEGAPIQYKYKNGRVDEEYDIPMDATLAKMLQRGTGSSAVQPDFLRYNPKTGKFRPLFGDYETVKDSKGQEISRLKKTADGKITVDEELSQPISESQLVLALGGRVTPTQRTIEMKRSLKSGNTDKLFKIDGKTYSRKQLNDMGYDDNEIEEFLKAGTITQ